MARSRFRYLLILLCAIPSLAIADFTISGLLLNHPGGEFLTLNRSDIDLRRNFEIAQIPIGPNGEVEATVEAEAGIFELVMPDTRKLPLVIDDGQAITISVDPLEPLVYEVKGSPDTLALQAYETLRQDALRRLVYPPRDDLRDAQQSGEATERIAELAELEVAGTVAYRRALNDYVLDNMGTSIALYATALRWDGDYRLDELSQRVADFNERHPGLAIGKSMQLRIDGYKAIAIGALAPSLEGVDLEGSRHALADFRGKYTLIDFWASWCGPCRSENRHYTALIKDFAEHPFTIFAVNLDSNSETWTRASRRDGVTWPQISDLQGWTSPFANAYQVTALPASYLLDPEGRIIAKNLRGEALKTALDEFLEIETSVSAPHRPTR